MPALEDYIPIGETGNVGGPGKGIYHGRFVMMSGPEQFQHLKVEDRAVWTELTEWLLGPNFRMLVLSKFDDLLHQRFGNKLGSLRFNTSFQLVRDFTDYSLGPHADHPAKVVVLLF